MRRGYASTSKTPQAWRLERLLLALTLVTISFLASIATHQLVATAAPPPRQEIDGDAALPWTTPADWASFSDAVATVTVTGERRTDLTAEERENKEGLEIRLVDLRVNSIIWRGRTRQQVPATLTVPHGGWSVHEGQPDRRLYLPNSPDLEVGHSYVMPLTWHPDSPAPWQALFVESILPADNGIIGQGETILGDSGKAADWQHEKGSARAALQGKPVGDIAKLLDGVTINPTVLANAALPAVERYRALLSAEAGR